MAGSAGILLALMQRWAGGFLRAAEQKTAGKMPALPDRSRIVGDRLETN
jgi:hypothetical protein